MTDEAITACVDELLCVRSWNGRRVLLVIPDQTRSAPIERIFPVVVSRLLAEGASVDAMAALGTHPPMSYPALCARVGETPDSMHRRWPGVRLLNHDWRNPDALVSLGVLDAEQVAALSGGRFAMDVPLTANRAVSEYDVLLIIGPVFPHEVVGFSGGNKYLFPGLAGQEIIDFFHWLGACITNRSIIGCKHTPVRAVIDAAAARVPAERLALCLIVAEHELVAMYAGDPESAWSQAADHSARVHVRYVDAPFDTVLSCAPPMYDDLWVGAKCMYKLEPVVADGGELTIYAPHITAVSVTHGALIEEIGYHCLDYFLADWERWRRYPWGVLAHSTHLKGAGAMIDGVEHPRIRVRLATGIDPERCRRIGLEYVDPATIDPRAYADREASGVLLAPNAGETLFRLKT